MELKMCLLEYTKSFFLKIWSSDLFSDPFSNSSKNLGKIRLSFMSIGLKIWPLERTQVKIDDGDGHSTITIAYFEHSVLG